MMHPRHRLALGLLLAASPGPAYPALPLDHARLQAATTWAENLSRTSHEPTQKSALMFAVAAAWEQPVQFHRDWLVRFTGDLAAQHVPRFDGLDHLAAGASLGLRRKFGLGPFAPFVQLDAGLHAQAARETGRSGWMPSATLQLGQRFTTGWRAVGGAGWTHFVARREPFDVRAHRLFLETSWDPNPRWRVSLGGSRSRGEFTANAAGAVWARALAGGFGPAVSAHYNSLAWEASDTFGPGWVAYRIRDSRADHRWLEIAPALSRRTSLALRHEAVRVVNALGIRYDSAFWTLRLVHQF